MDKLDILKELKNWRAQWKGTLKPHGSDTSFTMGVVTVRNLAIERLDNLIKRIEK